MTRTETTNPLLDEINATVDDPSIAVYLPIPLAAKLIELVGGERVTPEIGGHGTWIFPDGFRTWSTDEATRYALQAAPDVLEQDTTPAEQS